MKDWIHKHSLATSTLEELISIASWEKRDSAFLTSKKTQLKPTYLWLYSWAVGFESFDGLFGLERRGS